MTINWKLGATVMAIAALGLVGVAEAAVTTTKVSISVDDDVYSGSVTSSKTKCETDRKVSLFKQAGIQPKTTDKKIGSDLSNDDGDWKIKSGKEGKFYVRVKATTKCGSAISKRVKSED
jgi:hypothetical protein